MVRIVRASQTEIEAAVEELRAGELVAFPTETVYGLGANASNPAAVRKIFEAKGRPASHPVIVHLDSARYLHRWVSEVPEAALRLAERFWPGPLTLVMPRGPNVHDVVTGGQSTIAIRVPAHPMAQQLLTAFGGGIAAPSANRYGRLSPTRPEHVREELGGAVKIVLDGGECSIGIESTIVMCLDGRVRLLRPGGVTLAQLRTVVGEVDVGAAADSPRVPGSTPAHYAPLTPLEIVPIEDLETTVANLAATGFKASVLAMRPPLRAHRNATWINAGKKLETYAHNLYSHLRTLDKIGAHRILVQQVPADDRWDAVRDRLTRAAASSFTAPPEDGTGGVLP
ncbi:MAG TPA: L-threonylcarbamoyladenylate synthase [Steroidobacteraceae bacterium]|nr:L-threonylcarbamoyladenylate synthase [Steroidobacteraceae bacterium]